ncbi:cell death regulator Aven [Kryptolebias marmoratus]|uniref:cell death regulator Aven n=1 Tax=Kryptolebias marmoratus TaxID=37003 RepID=UPI0007F905B4|nr:cell death regulator Aven [Kryptolebias marmoratus]XP_024860768.1 cell death regulator Aven [Kryptolebias marmoratus]
MFSTVMEGRINRGRGGSWKRGGRGGNDADGEHRGRGRGGHHRGRGRRDHHRGRGRGGGSHADFPQRYQDEGDKVEDEDDRMEVFSRRKLESNWDRYEEAERAEEDADTPAQRGTDYHVLLESAGDSFTQFRFSDEKDWEMDSITSTQMLAVFLDLPALAQSLHQVPLHRRLNLEAELVQVSTPVELPAVSRAPKQEVLKTNTFTPPSTAFKGLGTNQKPSSAPVEVSSVADDGDEDEELDQLLSLEKPVSGSGPGEEEASPEKVPEEVVSKVTEEEVSPAKPVKEEMTEEDLEDWLDSMIS